MKRIPLSLIGCVGVLLSSCQSNDSLEQIVSQKYVHKYGFDLSEREWEEMEKEGKVVSMLKNGVTVTSSYDNGQLHGQVTHSFPYSQMIEKSLTYDQGNLLKETHYDTAGLPIREEVYEFDDRMIITLWNEKGSPLSIEEYDDEQLIEGKYYTPDHELEAQVERGFGERIKRNRSGHLLSRDSIENGLIAARTTYHPNGQIHTTSHYHDYQLHGEQFKYSAAGRPLLRLNWNHGVLDGPKIVYRNGIKISEIPYIDGQRHGIEKHYDDLGNLIAEIAWRNDKKHGSSQFFSEESDETEWFFNGQSVSLERYEVLENREKIVADFNGVVHTPSQ
jgi:antitoxin component YwqK of YwqJK toxin-antitoxin module